MATDNISDEMPFRHYVTMTTDAGLKPGRKGATYSPEITIFKYRICDFLTDRLERLLSACVPVSAISVPVSAASVAAVMLEIMLSVFFLFFLNPTSLCVFLTSVTYTPVQLIVRKIR